MPTLRLPFSILNCGWDYNPITNSIVFEKITPDQTAIKWISENFQHPFKFSRINLIDLTITGEESDINLLMLHYNIPPENLNHGGLLVDINTRCLHDTIISMTPK
jgi:hypothetical protein